MDPIITIINKLIEKNLPAINDKIDTGIDSGHLDPLVHVVSGDESLGSIDLGICTAHVGASYEVDNLRGLSGFTIDELQITSGGTNPEDKSEINGTVRLAASVKSSLKAGVGGSVSAGCGFLHKSIGLSGSVTADSISAISQGTFQASVKGGEVSLNAVRLQQLSVNYGGTSINIDGLGFFNEFLHPLEDYILGKFKGDIRSLIASSLTPVINNQIKEFLPLTQKL